MSLAPPPAGVFPSREELENSARQWAGNHQYAITVKRSDKNRVVLKCDKGGVYRNRRNLTDENRQRLSGTRLTNCPFEIEGKRDRILDVWQLIVKVPNHNHEPSVDQTAHPSLRRLTVEENETLADLTRARVEPRYIRTMLNDNGQGQALVMKDIYNARERIRNAALGGRTPIQALVEQLREDDFVWDVKTDDHGHVTHLFFAHRESLALYHSYPEVLLIDCTYKTNRYHLPLCNIVGITGLNTSFFLAFAFLKQERGEDYQWVLEKLATSVENFMAPGVVVTDRDLGLMNALSAVFPQAVHVLCKWHIRKNVEARCWPFFKDLPSTSAGTAEELWAAFLNDWDSLVASLTEAEYSRQLSYIKTQHRRHAFALQYIQSVWLNEHKQRFVHAWTHQHLHFNTLVTSRVEGSHSVLKRYISVSLHHFHKELLLTFFYWLLREIC